MYSYFSSLLDLAVFQAFKRGHGLAPGVFRPRVASSQVLLYHNVEADDSPWLRALGVTVPPADFERHLAYLAGRHPLVSFSRLCAGDAPAGAVAVTFDDGFKSVLDVALPILERYRCPFKVYLTESNVGARINWLNKLAWLLSEASPAVLGGLVREALAEPVAAKRAPSIYDFLGGFVEDRTVKAIDAAYAAHGPGEEPRLYLDAAEVETLAAHPLVELGSHTVHHYPLQKLGEALLYEEVIGGHERLAARFPGRIKGFAMPFGFKTHVVPAVARAAGAVDAVLVSAYGGPMRGAVLEGLPEIRRTPVFGNLGALWYAMRRA